MVEVINEVDLMDKRRVTHYIEAGDTVRINGEDYEVQDIGFGRTLGITIDGDEYGIQTIGNTLTLRPVVEEERYDGEMQRVMKGGDGNSIDVEEFVKYESEDLFETRRIHFLDYVNTLTQYPTRYNDDRTPRGVTGSDYADEVLASFMTDGKLPEVGKWVDETERQVVGSVPDYYEEMFDHEDPEVIEWSDLETGDKLIRYSLEKMQDNADRDFYKPPAGGIYEVGEWHTDEAFNLINPATESVIETVESDMLEERLLIREVKTGEHFSPDEYFRTCFVGLMLDSGWILKSEEEVLEGYRQLASKKNPHRGSRGLSDGSKGQWNVSMGHKLRGIRWLLGVDQLSEEARERVLWPDKEEEQKQVKA